MAKKELTEAELHKKEYGVLVNINQRLKNICECYYISYGNYIYVKSLVSFIEKVVVLHDDVCNSLSLFKGAMVMPNAFFDFTKNAKKTKLTINPTLESVYLGQNDNDEITHKINIVNQNQESDDGFINTQITPSMYKRFFTLVDDCYVRFDDCETYYDISEEELEALVNAEPIYLSIHGKPLTFTKQLVLDLKKGDTLAIARTCYQEIEDGKKRVFYTLKHTTNLYTDYTIFNVLQ